MIRLEHMQLKASLKELRAKSEVFFDTSPIDKYSSQVATLVHQIESIRT